jgi:hypothetical protein
MTEYIGALLNGIGLVSGFSWLILEIRHTDRFGKDRGPMPMRIRNTLIWIMAISCVAIAAWGLAHGNTLFLQ